MFYQKHMGMLNLLDKKQFFINKAFQSLDFSVCGESSQIHGSLQKKHSVFQKDIQDIQCFWYIHNVYVTG